MATRLETEFIDLHGWANALQTMCLLGSCREAEDRIFRWLQRTPAQNVAPWTPTTVMGLAECNHCRGLSRQWHFCRRHLRRASLPVLDDEYDQSFFCGPFDGEVIGASDGTRT